MVQQSSAKAAAPAPVEQTVGTLVPQTLERPLRPGEVSLDELERVFRETPGPVPAASQHRKPEPDKSQSVNAASDKEDAESTVASKSIRVSVDTLENLMTMVSELVLTRNQLLDIVRRHDESEFKVPLQRLSNVTAELQDGVMRTRMQPIGNAWQKLPRIVRDLSAELGKDIELEMHGADTELDRQVLERIKDPLTHMVRNSADHGLESRADRIAAGKPEKGIIRLSAYHEGGHIIIGVADDGRGLDIKRIRDKALANGLATEAELDKMSEQQIQKFIFTPGFSTAQTIDQRVRPRRRHGRGAQQHRSDRRQHRRAFGAGQRPELHHQDSADARHRLGADRGIGRRALRHPAAFRGRARSRARQVRASHRTHQGRSRAAASQQAPAARSPVAAC